MLRQLEGPANYLETKSFVEQVKDEKARKATMASVKEAQFKGVAHEDDEHKKEGSHGFDVQDCLEGSLPALALFLHRDPHTFASMGLHRNHGVANPKNFLKPKCDKPPIAEAIQKPGNDSFQTSQVNTSFYKIGVKDSDNDRQPCLFDQSMFLTTRMRILLASTFSCLTMFASQLTFSSLTTSFYYVQTQKTKSVVPCSLTLL
jgi:hypothetical protein